MTDPVTDHVTDQNSSHPPVRLESSAEERYTRAGAYVDESAQGGPARAKIGGGPAGEPGAVGEPLPAVVPAAVTEPGSPPPAAAGEQPAADRPPYFPLRRRGRNLRDAGHAGYHDAENPVAGLAAAYDYARAACTRAAKGGMPIPATEDALIDIGRALMAAGDTVTAAMHTWRPEL